MLTLSISRNALLHRLGCLIKSLLKLEDGNVSRVSSSIYTSIADFLLRGRVGYAHPRFPLMGQHFSLVSLLKLKEDVVAMFSGE